MSWERSVSRSRLYRSRIFLQIHHFRGKESSVWWDYNKKPVGWFSHDFQKESSFKFPKTNKNSTKNLDSVHATPKSRKSRKQARFPHTTTARAQNASTHNKVNRSLNCVRFARKRNGFKTQHNSSILNQTLNQITSRRPGKRTWQCRTHRKLISFLNKNDLKVPEIALGKIGIRWVRVADGNGRKNEGKINKTNGAAWRVWQPFCHLMCECVLPSASAFSTLL